MDVEGPMKSVLILSNFSSWCCYIDWYELKTILNVFFIFCVEWSGARLRATAEGRVVPVTVQCTLSVVTHTQTHFKPEARENYSIHSPEDDQSLLIETSSCAPSSF